MGDGQLPWPFVASASGLLENLVFWAVGYEPYRSSWQLSRDTAVVHLLVSAVVMAVLWFYHQRVETADARAVPPAGAVATIRRLYVYGFCAAGLVITAVTAAALLRWLMFQVGSSRSIGGWEATIDDIACLLVGLVLWLAFWRQVVSPDTEERTSVVRMLYLYGAVFVSLLATVTASAFILEGILHRLLAFPGKRRRRRHARPAVGRPGRRRGVGLSRLHPAARRRAGRRTVCPAMASRLYHYLVAGVGLAAALVGLAADQRPDPLPIGLLVCVGRLARGVVVQRRADRRHGGVDPAVAALSDPGQRARGRG